jgi:hypothetical protein
MCTCRGAPDPDSFDPVRVVRSALPVDSNRSIGHRIRTAISDAPNASTAASTADSPNPPVPAVGPPKPAKPEKVPLPKPCTPSPTGP